MIFPFHEETIIYYSFSSSLCWTDHREQTLPCMFWNEIAQKKFVVFVYSGTSFSCLMTQLILGRGYEFLYFTKVNHVFHVIFKLIYSVFLPLKKFMKFYCVKIAICTANVTEILASCSVINFGTSLNTIPLIPCLSSLTGHIS